MRKLAIAMALASTALAAPAVARDQSFYVGIEGGGLLVEDTDFDAEGVFDGEGVFEDGDFDLENAVLIEHKTGLDIDLIAGYDFGRFRGEFEAGYKRAGIDEIALSGDFGGTGDFENDGSVRVLSGMVNLLLDFTSDESGWTGFFGPGIGLAKVRYEIDDFDAGLIEGSGGESDTGLAWQVTAGLRKAISYNLDFGVKYRFFNVPNIEYEGDGSTALEGKFRSHSLLASLVYNFGAPPVIVPPPPVYVAPPPPPPPATQTCPDGSVILATDVCPPAYVPPPPPPVEPERG